MSTLAIIAGLSLIIVELLRSIPAYLRVRDTKSTDGISSTSTGILASTGLAWVALAILTGSIWVLLANLVWITFHVMLCRLVIKTDPHKRRSLLLSLLSSSAVLLIGAGIGQAFYPVETVLGVALTVMTLFYAIPATYAGLTSPSTRGLSLLSLSVNTMEGLIYFAAGMTWLSLTSTDEYVIGFIFFGLISIISNGLRLIRVVIRRAKGKDNQNFPVIS